MLGQKGGFLYVTTVDGQVSGFVGSPGGTSVVEFFSSHLGGGDDMLFRKINASTMQDEESLKLGRFELIDYGTIDEDGTYAYLVTTKPSDHARYNVYLPRKLIKVRLSDLTRVSETMLDEYNSIQGTRWIQMRDPVVRGENIYFLYMDTDGVTSPLSFADVLVKINLVTGERTSFAVDKRNGQRINAYGFVVDDQGNYAYVMGYGTKAPGVIVVGISKIRLSDMKEVLSASTPRPDYDGSYNSEHVSQHLTKGVMDKSGKNLYAVSEDGRDVYRFDTETLAFLGRLHSKRQARIVSVLRDDKRNLLLLPLHNRLDKSSYVKEITIPTPLRTSSLSLWERVRRAVR